MSENRTVHLVEIPIGGREGAIWNRLHSEREQICEAMLGNGDVRLLQSRLRKIDDALDRLMSGSTDSDDVELENLNPFHTIILHTHNSDYRILLLDPKTGRALIEGGEYLKEPKEALLKGSSVPGFPFKAGVLSVGSHLEMWVDERVLLTSEIESVHVKHSAQEAAQLCLEGIK